jgi:hypothetical protein
MSYDRAPIHQQVDIVSAALYEISLHSQICVQPTTWLKICTSFSMQQVKAEILAFCRFMCKGVEPLNKSKPTPSLLCVNGGTFSDAGAVALVPAAAAVLVA